MVRKLEGKVAVVTGASSGIGKSIVESYAQEGARVVAFARNLDALKALETAWPGQVRAVAGDVTRAEDLQHLVDEAVRVHGGVDVVVPNAGIARVVSFADSTAEAFHTQFSVNLFGAAETARLFVPHIRKGGSIQFITTFLTQVGFPGLAIYSASKAALKSLSQTLAAELAPLGIRVNSIAPGPIGTPLWGTVGCRPRSWGPSRRRSRPGSCLAHSVSRRISPSSRCSSRRTAPGTSTARKSSWMAATRSDELRRARGLMSRRPGQSPAARRCWAGRRRRLRPRVR